MWIDGIASSDLTAKALLWPPQRLEREDLERQTVAPLSLTATPKETGSALQEPALEAALEA